MLRRGRLRAVRSAVVHEYLLNVVRAYIFSRTLIESAPFFVRTPPLLVRYMHFTTQLRWSA